MTAIISLKNSESFWSWLSPQFHKVPIRSHLCTLQMKGWWESNIKVCSRFFCSRNKTAWHSYFQNRKYNVLSPNFQIHKSVSYLYIPRIGLPFFCSQLGRLIREYINRSQKHECRNWEWGRAVSFLGTHKSDIRYRALLGRQKFSSRAPCEVAEFWWQYIFVPHSAYTHTYLPLFRRKRFRLQSNERRSAL